MELLQQLLDHADPIPLPREFIEGMPHKNDLQWNRGHLWEVPRAIASTKDHYLKTLQECTENTRDAFAEDYPDLLQSPHGGNIPLTEAAWQDLRTYATRHGEMHSDTKADYVKHILTKHEGEARLVGEAHWHPFEGSDEDVRQPCFWHYQFANKASTRRFLYVRSFDKRLQDQPLSDTELDWILAEEGGATTMMKATNVNGASGARQWFIRAGNYITLAELFHFGRHRVTCWGMYRTYYSMDIVIHRRYHSRSTSGLCQQKQNAKRLHYFETHGWGS